MIGTIIGAATALGTGIASAVAAKRQQRRQNQATQELSKYQNDLNLAQWQHENEYNSPSAQMQRLQDAGVNPRLWWSNGSNTAASSPQLGVGDYQEPTSIGSRLSQVFTGAVNMVNQMNQIKQQEANMRLTDQQTNTLRSQELLNQETQRIKNYESMMRALDAKRYDLTWAQRYKLNSWKLNQGIANYLNNFGSGTLDLDSYTYGAPGVDLFNFREPLTDITRRKLATEISYIKSKALESVANTAYKNIGIGWMNRRFHTQDLQDALTVAQTVLARRNASKSEIDSATKLIQQSIMQSQKSFLDSRTIYQDKLNSNYLPIIGDISKYPELLFKLSYR